MVMSCYIFSTAPTHVVVCLYGHTPFCIKKKAKNGTFARKMNGATVIKLGMQTQLDSSNNMGWVPSSHTSSSLCVWLNMSKMVLLEKHFDLGSYTLELRLIQLLIDKKWLKKRPFQAN